MKNNFSIITNHAAFLIWNYSDRRGSETLNKPEIDQQIISTLSLKSLSITKSKSSAFGTFEARLAPTKNWIQLLTPGSWCAILMCRSALSEDDVKNKANKDKVKFFGRIDSIRLTVGVNQQNGARQSEYIVTGTDWGSIFSSSLYVDPALGWDSKNSDAPIGQVAKLIYQGQLDALSLGAPSTSSNVRVLLNMWGLSNSASQDVEDNVGIILKPEIGFSIPKEVLKYFGFSDKTGKELDSPIISNLIQIYGGKLKTLNKDIYNDSYDDIEESFGIIQGDDVLGSNEMWSTINKIGNPVINEMICDLRWDNEKPVLALYKRIKPFIINVDRLKRDNIQVGDRESAKTTSIDEYISEFKNIRRISIPLNEVLAFNCGTNWRDKINFVEVKPSDAVMLAGIAPEVRIGSQFYDKDSFSREGLKPYIAMMRHYPKKFIQAQQDGQKNAKQESKDKQKNESAGQAKSTNKDSTQRSVDPITEIKYLLKEWFFDTHRMLNGSITFFGQDRYIQVGDNLIVDAKITGYSRNTTYDQVKNRDKAFLLMHVENINHNFSVDENGVRNFITTVSFVRGIIVDENGSSLPFSTDFGQLEQDVTKLKLEDEINYSNVAIKTKMDPN